MIQELAREALKHKDSLDILLLCIRVLGGKHSDIVMSEIARQIKSSKKAAEEKQAGGKKRILPL